MTAEVFLRSSAMLTTALLLVVAYVASYLAKGRKKAFTDLVVIGGGNDADFWQNLQEAFRKHRNTPFVLPAEPSYLILPNRYIPEVKSLPETIASFSEETMHRQAGRYTGIGGSYPALHTSLKVDLTRNIGRVLAELQREADFAAPEIFGSCDEWTEVPVYAKTLQMVALLSGRVFVGYPLCRNEEWIDASINYTINAFGAIVPISKVPVLIRPLVVPFLSEVKKIRNRQKTAARLLKPIIEERLAIMKEDPERDLPNDVIQFLIRNSGDMASDVSNAAFLQMQLIAGMAAIHTTSMGFTHMIYDLCAHPEALEPLRNELESVIASDGGTLVKSSMTKLRKMDSFMKESQRLNPIGFITMLRLTKKDLHLSDGLKIPKGTSIAFNSIGTLMDPLVYPEPETFDAFRFSKLRDEPGNETKYQFVTTGVESFVFGHGIHACPGRFFASNELKIALIHLLRNYDVKFKDGHRRPDNIYQGAGILPDPTAEVMFRKRK